MYRQNNLTSKVNKYIRTNTGKMTRIISAFMLVFLIFGSSAMAQMTKEEAQAEIDKIDVRNDFLKSEILRLKGQEKTIQNDIDILSAQSEALRNQLYSIDSQIFLTSQKIDETNAQILKSEQDLLAKKKMLEEYIKVMYMDGQTSQIELVLTSNNFSDFVDRSEYLNTMSQKIQDTMIQIQELKKKLESDKQTLEVEKVKAEQLRAEQSTKKYALDSQIQQKDYLVSSLRNGQNVSRTEINSNNSKRGLYECIANGGCNGDSGGTLVVKNNIGLHYYQSDSRWNNYVYDSTFIDPTPGYNPNDEYWDSSTIGSWGCLITSLAMVHGFDPITEAGRHWYSGGVMQDNTAAVELGTNWNLIDQYLINGKPVIVGLKMDPPYYTHFVLLKGINSDGTYSVNDPAFAPGRTYAKSRVFNAFVPY